MEQGDEQLAGFEVPQAQRLVGRAGDEEAAIGRGRDGPDIALMADEIAEPVAVAVVRDEIASAAAGDDGLAIGGKAEAEMLGAVGRTSLDGGDGLAGPPDVEDGGTAIGPALAVPQRPGPVACRGAAERPGLGAIRPERVGQGILGRGQRQHVLERATICWA